DALDVERPPREVLTVRRHLEALAEAHVTGLFPGRRITWARAKAKRGPKGGIKNPCPNGPGTERIDAAILDEDEQALRRELQPKQRLLEWRGRGKWIGNLKPRIATIARRATIASGAGWWSSALMEHVETELEGTAAPTLVERWKTLDLDTWIERMVPPGR